MQLKHLFIHTIILSIFLTTKVKSQDGQYLKMNPIWHYVQETNYGLGEDWKDHINYQVSDSTIINGKMYYEILKTGYKEHNWYFSQSNSGQEITPFNEIEGYIRVENDTMFAFDNGFEYSLYNFSLSIGDTSFSESVMGYQNLGIVESIDTIHLSGLNLRRFYFENSLDHLIEGIGTHHGLFRPSIGIEWIGDLQCYQLGNNIYLDTIGFPQLTSPNECLTNVSISENGQNPIIIFPNPASTRRYFE